MKPGGGKAKGGDFERWVAKQLSEWATGIKGEAVFWRTAGSGSRGTLVGAKHQLGDIGSIAPAGNDLTAACMIECKFYKSLGWEAFLFDGRGTLDKFWIDLQMAAIKHQRVPLLIGKENGRAARVIMPLALAANAPADVILPRANVASLTMESFLGQQYSDFTARAARLKQSLYATPPDSRPAPHAAARTRVQVKVPRVALRPIRTR